jgi:hypothetical protein
MECKISTVEWPCQLFGLICYTECQGQLGSKFERMYCECICIPGRLGAHTLVHKGAQFAPPERIVYPSLPHSVIHHVTSTCLPTALGRPTTRACCPISRDSWPTKSATRPNHSQKTAKVWVWVAVWNMTRSQLVISWSCNRLETSEFSVIFHLFGWSRKDGAGPALYLIFVLLYVLFVLCRSLYCLCVYVYCTTAPGCLPNCS